MKTLQLNTTPMQMLWVFLVAMCASVLLNIGIVEAQLTAPPAPPNALGTDVFSIAKSWAKSIFQFALIAVVIIAFLAASWALVNGVFGLLGRNDNPGQFFMIFFIAAVVGIFVGALAFEGQTLVNLIV